MIPYILTLLLLILTLLPLAIPGLFLCIRWFDMFESGGRTISPETGDMQVPTFYAIEGDSVSVSINMSFVGGVFGGIHCVGWFFDFPSSAEAMLWRVSSAILTITAFASAGVGIFKGDRYSRDEGGFLVAPTIIISVVCRLILTVEAFISLRHLTPGMLALVKWTSFIPHI